MSTHEYPGPLGWLVGHTGAQRLPRPRRDSASTARRPRLFGVATLQHRVAPPGRPGVATAPPPRTAALADVVKSFAWSSASNGLWSCSGDGTVRY